MRRWRSRSGRSGSTIARRGRRVEARSPAVTHTVSMRKVEDWLRGGARSPRLGMPSACPWALRPNNYSLAFFPASAFRFAPHLWRIRSAAALLWAAQKLRPFLFAGLGAAFTGAAAAAEVVTARGFFGGRPRRLIGPWRA
jgi:hypothetical protein